MVAVIPGFHMSLIYGILTFDRAFVAISNFWEKLLHLGVQQAPSIWHQPCNHYGRREKQNGRGAR